MNEVRLATVREVVEMVEWLRAQSEANGLDEDILDYPTATFLRAGDKAASCYLPCHAALILESLAMNQNLSPLARVKGAISCVQKAEIMAEEKGLREVYFSPGRLEAGAIAAKHLGYTPIALFKKKVGK